MVFLKAAPVHVLAGGNILKTDVGEDRGAWIIQESGQREQNNNKDTSQVQTRIQGIRSWARISQLRSSSNFANWYDLKDLFETMSCMLRTSRPRLVRCYRC